MVGSPAAIRARRASPVRAMNGGQPACAQIVAGRKTWLPKAWSKWPWVLTTTVTGSVGQHPQVGQDLAPLDVRRAGVDDERRAVAEDHPDVLVVELIAPHEHAIAELDPGGHERMVAAGRVTRAGPSFARLRERASIVAQPNTASGERLVR